MTQIPADRKGQDTAENQNLEEKTVTWLSKRFRLALWTASVSELNGDYGPPALRHVEWENDKRAEFAKHTKIMAERVHQIIHCLSFPLKLLKIVIMACVVRGL